MCECYEVCRNDRTFRIGGTYGNGFFILHNGL